MSRKLKALQTAMLALALLASTSSQSEILAMLNYESKPTEPVRKEGIAIIDVDPASANFNKIVKDIPLPPDLVAHHIFYNRDLTKAYVTALGQSVLHIFDLKDFPEAEKIVNVPDCKVGEDIAFSKDRKSWYLTCMGSSNIIVGDAQTDKVRSVIAAPGPAAPFIKTPHGLALNDELDRIIVTSTVRPDLKDPGETVTIVEASTQKVLSTHRLSNKPFQSGEAPVEVAFTPSHNPALAYIANMYGATLWTAAWRPETKDFAFQQAFDFSGEQQGVPLEMGFNDKADRLYVTTAKPGHFNIFDIGGDAFHPKLIKAIPTAPGAHHFAISPDGRYVFVQNSLLNLPDMSDGSVTVINLQKNEPIATVDVLKKAGFNPNCIILLPKWYRSEG